MHGNVKTEQNMSYVPCAFCHATGKDPFGIMSRLSLCYVCGGEKALWIEKPFKQCMHCNGSGVSTTGVRNHCAVCGGAGVVHIPECARNCPECKGSGWQKGNYLYCNHCKGVGVVPAQKEEG